MNTSQLNINNLLFIISNEKIFYALHKMLLFWYILCHYVKYLLSENIYNEAV